jgi:hypothetical protein
MISKVGVAAPRGGARRLRVPRRGGRGSGTVGLGSRCRNPRAGHNPLVRPWGITVYDGGKPYRAILASGYRAGSPTRNNRSTAPTRSRIRRRAGQPDPQLAEDSGYPGWWRHRAWLMLKSRAWAIHIRSWIRPRHAMGSGLRTTRRRPFSRRSKKGKVITQAWRLSPQPRGEAESPAANSMASARCSSVM